MLVAGACFALFRQPTGGEFDSNSPYGVHQIGVVRALSVSIEESAVSIDISLPELCFGQHQTGSCVRRRSETNG